MTFLPNANNVEIDPPKLTYLLITGKAKFFISHGFDPARPMVLDAALREHPLRNQVETMVQTVHGMKYTVRCSFPSPDSRDPCVFTVWIVDAGKTRPRLVTAYASPPPP